MNAYEKAQALGLTGDDKTQFATLQQYGLTHRPISRAELVHTLNLIGMLRKKINNNADEKWTGTVLAMQDQIEAGGTDGQKQGMALWLSHITNPTNVLWDTTQPEFAAGFWSMYEAFRDQPGMPTSADFAAIAALGGGWIAITLEDFTAQREVAEHTAAVSQIITATQAAATALHVRAGEIEAQIDPSNYDPSQHTVAAVQAYCDGLLEGV